jgi:hypothetical protein
MTISIILPARNIPDGQEVFKINGVRPLTLKTRMRLFTQGTKGNQDITPSAGMVYLVGLPDADINQVPADTPLRVDFPEAGAAREFLEDLQVEDEDK